MSQRRPGRKRKASPITVPTWQGPTSQRLQHASAGGQALAVETYLTDSGEKTQLQRMRLIKPLESMWKAEIISSGQYGAARRYQKDADMAAVSGPASAARYEPRWIDGGGDRFLLPIEASVDHLMRLAAAQVSCGQKSRRVLEWIATELTGWRQQARIWFAGANDNLRQRAFLSLLRATCDSLESHYRGKS